MSQTPPAMFLSPLDGRYRAKVEELAPIFSEFGLTRFRLQVEIEWLIFLSEKNICPPLSAQEIITLRSLFEKFSAENFSVIKDIEARINHDVKAVEVFLRSHTSKRFHSFLHFGCTSEDINSASYGLMLTQGKKISAEILTDTILPNIRTKALAWKNIPMLSRTHGQTATPSTMGKEWLVFFQRLKTITTDIMSVPCLAKFSGATGNWATHQVAFPEVDWMALSQEFIEKRLGLTWNGLTTQIEPHDTQAKLLNEIARAATVLIDFCRDIWGYISLGYFGQIMVKGEVGSSTMPHKVNPIDFENAEGNLKLARGIARTLADELPLSRWQRDLTDSTLQRNLGLVFGHFLLALKSLAKGIGKLEIRGKTLAQDLANSPEVLTEAVQTVLRKHGQADAYDQLKKFSRGRRLTLAEIHQFIDQTDIDPADKDRLKNLTPADYIGFSVALVEKFSQ